MGGQHPPGYQAARRRIERYVLRYVREHDPDLYRQAWAAGQAREDATELPEEEG